MGMLILPTQGAMYVNLTYTVVLCMLILPTQWCYEYVNLTYIGCYGYVNLTYTRCCVYVRILTRRCSTSIGHVGEAEK